MTSSSFYECGVCENVIEHLDGGKGPQKCVCSTNGTYRKATTASIVKVATLGNEAAQAILTPTTGEPVLLAATMPADHEGDPDAAHH